MADRVCGTCTACCTVMGVAELGKEPYRRCGNLRSRGGGCRIYADRPAACASYACEWLKGLGQRRDRPDRVGLIVDALAAVQGGEDGARSVCVREVVPGALHSKRGRALAQWLHSVAGLTVALRPFGGRRLPVGRPL